MGKSNFIGLFGIICIIVLSTQNFSAQTYNYWIQKNDFGGLKRERAVAFVVNNEAFVGTGIDTAENVLNDLWKYDQTTDSWSQVANVPGSVRRDAVAFSIGNFGYVGTGIDADDAGGFSVNVLNDFWQYDPVANTWQSIAPLPANGGSGVYFATGFAIGTKGYVCAGKIGDNFYSNQLWEYSPALNSWTQKPNFPGGVRYQLGSFTLGDKAYVGWGTDQDYYRKDVWEFSPSTNTWTAKNDCPASPRAGFMTFSLNHRGYLCMGTTGALLEDLWEYNPVTDNWSPRANYGGSKRKNGVAFVVDGRAFVGTGKGYDGKKQSMYEYVAPPFVGIEELTTFSLTVYPNPADDYIHMKSEQTFDQVSLFAIDGNEVLRSSSSAQLDVKALPAGVYLVRATNSETHQISQQKIIIR